MARQTITTTVTRERRKKERKKIPKLVSMKDVKQIPSLNRSGGRRKRAI